MGFCLYSNVAIGARAAQAAGLKRVAVVDFDVHHGNGTQELLGDDPVKIVDTIKTAICAGAAPTDLSRSLAYAAALRVARYPS